MKKRVSFEAMRKCNQVQHPQVIQKTAVNEVSGREDEREKGFLRCKSVTMVTKGYTLRFVEKSIKIRVVHAAVLLPLQLQKPLWCASVLVRVHQLVL